MRNRCEEDDDDWEERMAASKVHSYPSPDHGKVFVRRGDGDDDGSGDFW